MDSPEIRRFKDLTRKADDLLMEDFGLSDKEKDYVYQRLAAHPMDVMQPRSPWTHVAMREIQEYDVDRFA